MPHNPLGTAMLASSAGTEQEMNAFLPNPIARGEQTFAQRVTDYEMEWLRGISAGRMKSQEASQ